MIDPVQAATFAFVALLAAALAISIVAQRLRVPPEVLLVAAGTAAGMLLHVRPPFDFTPAIVFVFLPPLIFEAAWALDVEQLRRQWWRIAFLAVPGTLLTAFVVAFGLSWMGLLPFGAALLLGAIVSATDPVAVVAVFRAVAVPSSISTIVEAESLANDGIAVVLYGIALVLAGGAQPQWLPQIAHGLVAVVVGALIGVACALPFYVALRLARSSEYEITATLALAYASYLLALGFEMSGIFASAAAAITLRALVDRRNAIDADAAGAFWRALAYIANAVVFISTGLLIEPWRILHEPLLVSIALVLALAIRAALAGIVGRGQPERITIFLAGMRGALPLALALALPANVPFRAEIIDTVYAVVLFTLIAQGVPLAPVTKALFAKEK